MDGNQEGRNPARPLTAGCGARHKRRERYEILFGLTYAYELCILMCMRTTLNIDDQLLKRAAKLSGVSEKTTLVRLGLEALIAQESAKRLAALGGTEKELKNIPRRKSLAP